MCFKKTLESPPLVPEEIDEEATLSLEEVIEVTEVDVIETAETAAVIERVTVEEHFLRIEYVPARLPERRGKRATGRGGVAAPLSIVICEREASSASSIWMHRRIAPRSEAYRSERPITSINSVIFSR